MNPEDARWIQLFMRRVLAPRLISFRKVRPSAAAVATNVLVGVYLLLTPD